MVTTLNESYQSKPLTVAQGGTGIATNTAYGLLAGGTTATGALQQGGTGTTGQIYLSGGNAALGTWSTTATSLGFQFISQQTASGSASIAFTGLSATYYAYKIIITSVVPATNAQRLNATLSSDNGSTYFSANYSYAMLGRTNGGTALTNASSSAATIQLSASSGIPNTANTANHFEITLFNPSVTALYNGFNVIGRYNDAGSRCVMWGEGSYALSSAINAIKFTFASGNISTGVFTLFGMLT